MRDSPERVRAAGMNGHLIKPIDPVVLAAALADHARPVQIGAAGPRPTGVVDEEHLRSLVDALGAAKVVELLTQLPEYAGPYREQLAEALALGDLVSVHTAAHALSGMAGSLGLTALSELTGAIEEACLEGQTYRVAALCERLDPSIDAAFTRLRTLQL